jgi:hypothetical protein
MTALRIDRSKAIRRLLIALVTLLGLIVVIRVVLDPVATYGTRKGLEQMHGMKGDFRRVHVTVLSPGYTINRLKLIQDPGGQWRSPLFYAESIHVGLDWRHLLHGQLLAAVRIVEPKVTVLAGAAPSEKTKTPKAPDLSAQLEKITPLKVDRLEVLRGELLFRDLGEPHHPELWVHRLDLAAENLPTRDKLLNGRPTTVNAHGTVGKSGDMTLFVSADPFARPLAFAGRFQEQGLRVAELFDFIEPKTKLQTPAGTFDLFTEFKVRDGRITGGVKPVLKNVQVRPAESGMWDRLKAWLADKAVHFASDRVPDRNAVATTVPIEGRLVDPDIQLWPAILGVVRNAFVEGLTAGFTELPPPQAGEKQSVLTQAKAAVTKSDGPPKAQPAKTDVTKADNDNDKNRDKGTR